jgi:probable phosphoglycerate mutase
MATVFTVIRHGETAANRNGVIQGQTDVPLSPEGEKQARLLGRRWRGKHFDAVYSSDLSRALRTAELAFPAVKPTATPALREMNLGAWVGHTTFEIAERFPKEWRAFRAGDIDCRITDGESRRELIARTEKFFREAAARHAGQEVLVVTHGGVLRAFFMILMGGAISEKALLPSTGNTGINVVHYDDRTERWRLTTWNDTAHLDSLLNGEDAF